MAKRKRTNNDLQNITHKTKEKVTQTPLKTRGELRCSGRVAFISDKLVSNTILTRSVWLVEQKLNTLLKPWVGAPVDYYLGSGVVFCRSLYVFL